MSKALTPLDDAKTSIMLLEPELKKALPSHMTSQKFIRTVQTALSTNPDLVTADRRSFMAACMRLASEGLLADGREAAIVTFKTKNGVIATPMPMIQGILKKVRNSGELSSISPQVVYENDDFEYWIDENGEHLKHRPNLNGDRGQLKLVYCIAKTKDGGIYIEVMSKEEIEKVRNTSRSKDGGPWSQWYTEMARKTVIRRLAKRLPVSSDIDGLIRADDELYDLGDKPNVENVPEVKDVSPEKPAKKVSKKLSKIVEAELEPESEEQSPIPDDKDLPL
jgi:recombination protein RecT